MFRVRECPFCPNGSTPDLKRVFGQPGEQPQRPNYSILRTGGTSLSAHVIAAAPTTETPHTLSS